MLITQLTVLVANWQWQRLGWLTLIAVYTCGYPDRSGLQSHSRFASVWVSDECLSIAFECLKTSEIWKKTKKFAEMIYAKNLWCLD